VSGIPIHNIRAQDLCTLWPLAARKHNITYGAMSGTLMYFSAVRYIYAAPALLMINLVAKNV
jgi:hypothetical protein